MTKTYILSIDPANKSLAISFFSYNNNYNNDIKEELKKKELNYLKLINIDKILNNIIDIKYMDVIDLFPDIKVIDINILDRTNLFKLNILNINKMIFKYIEEFNINEIIVCIEYQPVFNNKSNVVFNQLIYEYSCNKIFNIQIMYPVLKNKIYFHPLLKHKEFISKYNNLYIANKMHTRENFLYFIKIFNLEKDIKHIQKKNLDDISDTFLQSIAYLKFIKKCFNN